MSVSVNPPPQLKLPQSFAKEREIVTYFRHLDRMLLQLWTRTGGAIDLIGESTEGEDNNNQIMMLTSHLNALRGALRDVEQNIEVTNIADIITRIEALEDSVEQVIDLTNINARLTAIEAQL